MAHFLLLEHREHPLSDMAFDAGQIETLIAPSLQAMGYSIVRVSFTGGKRGTLQIMVERIDDATLTVEDCATVSHTVSALLDVPIRSMRPICSRSARPGSIVPWSAPVITSVSRALRRRLNCSARSKGAAAFAAS